MKDAQRLVEVAKEGRIGDLSLWRQQNIVRSCIGSGLSNPHVQIKKPDMAKLCHPFVPEKANWQVLVEGRTACGELAAKGLRDWKLGPKLILIVERFLIIAKSVGRPSLAVKIFAQLNVVVVDQKPAGIGEFPIGRDVVFRIIARSGILVRHHR